MMHLFSPFNKHLFSAYYGPDTILVALDISVNKTKISEVKELTSQKGRHILNMRNKVYSMLEEGEEHGK